MARKGKEIAEASHASGSEEDLPRPQRKRQRQTKKKDASQSSTPKDTSKKTTPALRMAMLRKIEFEQTRWADHQLLHDLGIFEDVERLFANMGLLGLFNMAEVGHKEETYQFLATMSFHDDTSLDVVDANRGRLDFKIHGKDYSITMAQLGMLFHFPSGDVNSFDLDDVEIEGMWRMIATNRYNKGVSKAAHIRHPAIRYAHKLLASTLFARREAGNVKEEELALLIEGLKSISGPLPNGKLIEGQPEPVNFAHFLARRFLFYQDWIVTKKDSTPKLSIGGLITPILRACNVEIRQAKEEPFVERVDAPCLATARILAGRLKRSYGYRFRLGGEPKIILLPNVEATTFDKRENITFKPQAALLYNPTRDGKMTTVRPRKTATQEEEVEDVEIPEPIYGSKRYEFEPYGAPISGTALKAAHEHIRLLQRLAKWQGKQIKKLVKTVKKQGKMIKKLLKDQSTSPSMEATQAPDEGPSTREEARPSKGKAPLSPSSSDSGNYCYDMDSSSSSPSQTF